MTRTIAAVCALFLAPSFAHADTSLEAIRPFDAGYDAGYYDGETEAEFYQSLKEDEKRARREDKLMGLRSYTDPDDDTSYIDPDGVPKFHHRPTPQPPPRLL